MSIYLTPSRLPELVPLSAKQRRFVWRQCVHPHLLRVKVRILGFVVFVTCALTGWWLGDSAGVGTWGGVIGAAFLVGLGSYLHDMFWTSRYRPQIAQFIHDHAAEIQSVA
jgi:small-conductance mechanosensitive channel